MKPFSFCSMKSAFYGFISSGLLFLIGLYPFVAVGQSPGKKETLEYINQKVGNATSVFYKAGSLIIVFKDKDGSILREDSAPVPDLDLNVFYEPESGLLCIPCVKGIGDCVTRVLVLEKVKRSYGRLSIPLKDAGEFQSLQKAFEHFIRLISVNGYHDTVIFD